VKALDPAAYIPMLETGEMVAERYNISREAQDDIQL
jgi:acetyl-CoA C-acetyltransferase